MLITNDTSASSGADANTTSLSYTVGAGSGAIMFIGVVSNLFTDTITNPPTYNGVASTLVGSIDVPSNPATSQFLYYINNPPQGVSHTVSATLDSGTKIQLFVASYLGSPGIVTPNVNTGSVGGSAGTSTLSLTTLTNNAWTISLIGTYNNGNPAGNVTVGTGTTSRQILNATPSTMSSGIGDSNGAITPAGSYSMTWNWANVKAGMIIAEIPAQANNSGFLMFM